MWELSSMYTSWDIYIYIYTLFPMYFRLVAAIFDFQHTQTSDSIPTSLHVAWLQKQEYSRWNFFAIMYMSWDKYTSFPMYFRLVVAIFDFRHTMKSASILTTFFVLPDPENMGIAVGILLLSCIRAEIRVTTSFLPPSWISGFRFHLAVLLIAPLSMVKLSSTQL